MNQIQRHFGKPLDEVSDEELNGYFNQPKIRKLSRSSILLRVNSLCFLFKNILHRVLNLDLVLPKKKQKVPEYLSRRDVNLLINECKDLRLKTMIMLCYGCGLRLSEVTNLKVSNIDGERQTLKIENGKGGKDRYVVLSDTMLQQLRAYWYV